MRRRYDFVHVHNLPDFLVFAALLPKLTGARVILDIHDIVPEFYASKFHLKPDSFGVRMLKLTERASASFADHVIISNHLWHETFIARSVPGPKCTVFINYVNGKIFHPQDPVVRNGKTIILFPGGLQWHQGLDVAIRALPAVVERMPEVEFHIYGDGNMKEELVFLARSLGLREKVRFFDPLPVKEIVKVMAGADLGVVPKRADSFGNEAYSTKIMEFMSVRVPVVVSSTKIDRYYFDDSMRVRFFESGGIRRRWPGPSWKFSKTRNSNTGWSPARPEPCHAEQLGNPQGGLFPTHRFALRLRSHRGLGGPHSSPRRTLVFHALPRI